MKTNFFIFIMKKTKEIYEIFSAHKWKYIERYD